MATRCWRWCLIRAGDLAAQSHVCAALAYYLLWYQHHNHIAVITVDYHDAVITSVTKINVSLSGIICCLCFCFCGCSLLCQVSFRARVGRRHRRDAKGVYPPQLDVVARYAAAHVCVLISCRVCLFSKVLSAPSVTAAVLVLHCQFMVRAEPPAQHRWPSSSHGSAVVCHVSHVAPQVLPVLPFHAAEKL